MLAALSASAAFLATGQVSPGGTSPPTLDFSFTLPPDRVPDYLVVKGFFELSSEALADGPEAFEHSVLRELEIAPNSIAAAAIEEGTRAAAAELSMSLDLRGHLQDDPATFDRVQYDFLRTRVRRTAFIYRELLRELRLCGVGPQTLKAFLDSKIRPHVVVGSTEPIDGNDETIRIMVEEFKLQQGATNNGEANP